MRPVQAGAGEHAYRQANQGPPELLGVEFAWSAGPGRRDQPPAWLDHTYGNLGPADIDRKCGLRSRHAQPPVLAYRCRIPYPKQQSVGGAADRDVRTPRSTT